MSKHINVVISDETYKEYEKKREEAGLSKSKFIEYLLSVDRDIRPKGIAYKRLLSMITDLNLYLRVIMLEGRNVSVDDKEYIFSKLDGIQNDVKKL